MNDVSSFLQQGLPAEMVETFAHLLFSDDGADASLLIEQLFADGVTPEMIMLGLLAPAARLMGDMWCSDRLSFVDVTLGLSRIQQVLRQIRLPEAPAGHEKGRALLVPVPGEQHTFGLRLVEEFLIRNGWSVTCNFRASHADILDAVAAKSYNFVGFSISCERLLPALRSAIRGLRSASRNPELRIMVGGVLFTDLSAEADSCGADAVAIDADDAVAKANAWFALAGVE